MRDGMLFQVFGQKRNLSGLTAPFNAFKTYELPVLHRTGILAEPPHFPTPPSSSLRHLIDFQSARFPRLLLLSPDVLEQTKNSNPDQEESRCRRYRFGERRLQFLFYRLR